MYIKTPTSPGRTRTDGWRIKYKRASWRKKSRARYLPARLLSSQRQIAFNAAPQLARRNCYKALFSRRDYLRLNISLSGGGQSLLRLRVCVRVSWETPCMRRGTSERTRKRERTHRATEPDVYYVYRSNRAETEMTKNTRMPPNQGTNLTLLHEQLASRGDGTGF